MIADVFQAGSYIKEHQLNIQCKTEFVKNR